MKTSIFAVALAGSALLTTPASAAIVANIGNNEVFCESQSLSFFAGATCLGGNEDLSNSAPSGDSLTFEGLGLLAGFVADADGSSGDYPDYANITLSQNSLVTFFLIEPTAGFDALFTFGGLVSQAMTAADTVNIVATAGTYAFGLDATAPTNSLVRETSSYILKVAPVPLPAGALLLLTGVGAFAAARRKKTA